MSVNFLGLCCLTLLVSLHDFWQIELLIAFILVVRTALMNSRQAIIRSVLHDYVPKATRGRWTAVDKITGFGWSGSAFIGGLLLDRISFVWVFLTTLLLQILASTCLLPLLWLVPRVEAAVTEVAASKDEETKGLLSDTDVSSGEATLIAASDTETQKK